MADKVSIEEWMDRKVRTQRRFQWAWAKIRLQDREKSVPSKLTETEWEETFNAWRASSNGDR